MGKEHLRLENILGHDNTVWLFDEDELLYIHSWKKIEKDIV